MALRLTLSLKFSKPDISFQTLRYVSSNCNLPRKLVFTSNVFYFISSFAGRPALSCSFNTSSTLRADEPSSPAPATPIPTLATTSSSEPLTFASVEKGVQLIYRKHGNPLEVLELVECARPPSLSPAASGAPVLAHNRPDAVLIKMLASPIHPADINLIQGTYPYKPSSFPVVGGYDGVAQVLEVGPAVAGIKKGDWVLPLSANGVWRSFAICREDELLRVDNKLPLLTAASLFVVGATAFRMLRDFASLEPGDTVVQNAANSACGQAVIQLCKHWGLKSLNIVRARADIDAVRRQLSELGASVVLTENEARDAAGVARAMAAQCMSPPRLGLNAVGGRSVMTLSRLMADCGSVVTYGGMSQEHSHIPTTAFIFKRLTFTGFWLFNWKRLERERVQRVRQRLAQTGAAPVGDEAVDRVATMVNELVQIALKGAFRAPSNETFEVHDFRSAVSLALAGFGTEPTPGKAPTPAEPSRVLHKKKPILVFT